MREPIVANVLPERERSGDTHPDIHNGEMGI